MDVQNLLEEHRKVQGLWPGILQQRVCVHRAVTLVCHVVLLEGQRELGVPAMCTAKSALCTPVSNKQSQQHVLTELSARGTAPWSTSKRM